MTRSQSRKVVIVAVLANAFVTLTKFAAGIFTGSSAMLSEAVHSLVDTGNEALLIYGQHRAGRPADAAHPLGYGRELYFWSFIVALLIFAVGSGLSIYQGVAQILHPEPITNVLVNFGVIGAAFLFDGYSWVVSLRSFLRSKGRRGWLEALHLSKDPPNFMVLFEDSADLIGLALAFLGNAASIFFDLPVIDGVASIAIGILLAIVAIILARETKRLLIGETADPALLNAVISTALGEDGVTGARVLYSMQLAPDDVLVAMAVEFAQSANRQKVEATLNSLQKKIDERHAPVRKILVTMSPTKREAASIAGTGVSDLTSTMGAANGPRAQ